MTGVIGRALRSALSSVALLAVLLLPATVAAQNARDGRVQVTVVDPSGAIVPDATVTVVGLEPSTQATTIGAGKSSDKGIATFERVTPGRYSITAEFPGFDLGLLRDVRVRAGDSRHVVVLPLQKLEDKVVVARDTQEAAADRRSSEFGLKLNDDQINALSDDPNELKRQLDELAGPDAVIRVDSFEGQQLPPKAQIKSIHVTRDQFAAEAANPGSTFVDIITQPGVGPIRGGLNVSFRDGAMTGRSQFTDRRVDEQQKGLGGNIGGTLIEGRTSFNISVNGQTDYITPILKAKLPEGERAETLTVRQPNSFARRCVSASTSTATSVRTSRSAASTCRSAASARSSGTRRSASRRPGRSAGGRSSTRACRTPGSSSTSIRQSKRRPSSCRTRLRQAVRSANSSPTCASCSLPPTSTTCAAATRGEAACRSTATGSARAAASTISGPIHSRALTTTRSANRSCTRVRSARPRSLTRTFKGLCTSRTTSV
jgi:hypothetical protein